MMKYRAESSKLAELRSKTDRQILALVSRQLDAAIESMQKTGDLPSAEQAYEEARRWITLAQSSPQPECRIAERKLNQLATLLGRKLVAACA